MGDRELMAAGRIKIKAEKPIDLAAINKLTNLDDLDKEPNDADETDDMMNDPSLLAELKSLGWKDPAAAAAGKKKARRRNSDEEAERELAALHDDDDDADGEGDDADLAGLHDDDDEPTKKSKAAKNSSSSGAQPKKKTAAAVPTPNPANTAAHRDTMIQKLKTYQQEATQKALELKRAGKADECMNVFRQAKAAEARVKALESGGSAGDDLSSFFGDMDKLLNRVKATADKAQPPTPIQPVTKPSAAAAAAAAAAATTRAPVPNATAPAPNSGSGSDRASQLAILNTRWSEYRDACLTAKNAGNQPEALRLFADSKKYKAAIDALEAGQSVNMASLPPPLSSAAAARTTPAVTPSVPPKPAAKAAAGAVSRTAAAAESKNQVKTPTAAAAPAKVTPVVPPRPSATTVAVATSTSSSSNRALSVRDEVVYDDLIGKMGEQIDKLKSLMDQIYNGDETKDIGPAPVKGGRAALEHAAKVKAAEPTLAQRQTALQYFRYKKTSTHQRDLLVAARKRGIRPPAYHTEKVVFDYELRHDDVKENELELNVVSARNLTAAQIGSSDNLNGYVMASMDFPKDQQHKSSPIKGGSPVWDAKWRFNIQDRSKATFRKFKFLKMSFAVWHKRALLKDQLIGQGELKLLALQSRAEIKEWVKLRNNDGKQAGDVEVVVRLQKPLEGRDIRQTTHELLVIGDFPDEAPPVPVTRPAAVAAAAAATHTEAVIVASSRAEHQEAPTDELIGEVQDLKEDDVKDSAASHDEEEDLKNIDNIEATPASARRAAAPQPTAAAGAVATATAPAKAAEPAAGADGIPANELRDPLHISLYVSNDVLEAEMKSIDQRIATAKAQNKPADELGERKMACFVALQVLVTKVQNGKLTMEQYLELLRKRLVADQHLAVALHKRNRATEAAAVMARVKIMQTEITNAEANKDAIEE